MKSPFRRRRCDSRSRAFGRLRRSPCRSRRRRGSCRPDCRLECRSRRGILYLAGRPRAQTFEERLDALRLYVRITEVYEMVPVEYQRADLADILVTSRPEAVLLYSRENAQRFFDLATPHAEALYDMQILCMSDRTAAGVPAEYSRHIRVAKTPSEDALLTLL
ncbi:uroporphyrinogen-III synthase [Aliirhizobium terrae]|uniref:uroporphyrinogen-III synthase n=1 Tax=Terrirhizobium terrae TaxID=2926709 RepID=UPI0025768CC1|nr:uroporphyrinogen-III synthase [Rhizobium sp. CC-CFT758]WJH41340.1 uroporphyrinogen-III synthase [Rhizobium sp. CC-CFT758]